MSESKTRRKLNAGQLQVLELLYNFRFASSDLIAEYFGKQGGVFAYQRLKTLHGQGLIGKRYEPIYRLQGKPVAYYLLPEGARRLQEQQETEINIKAIYKDKTVSEQFVEHCFAILRLRNQLKAQYGDRLRFFTKSQLNYDKYEHFPKPLPDAYIRLETEEGKSQFFLDIYHDSQPFFTALRKVKQYIDYSEEADWSVTETDLPTILIVCESLGARKRLHKRIPKLIEASWEDDMRFGLATMSELLSGEEAAWQLVGEPEEQLSLDNI